MSAEYLKTLEDIKDNIAEGKVKTAIKSLLHFVRNDYEKEHENDIINISSRYYNVRKEKLKGKIPYEEHRIELANINDALLDIINSIEEDLKTPIKDEPTPQPKPPQQTAPTDPSPIIIENITEPTSPKPSEQSKEIALKAKDILKTYKRSNFELKVETLELPLNTITALVGENATGKTTLINILAGELACDEGQLQYPLFQKNSSLQWTTIKQQIAYIPQFLPAWHKDLYRSLCYEAVTHGIATNDIKKEVDYIVHRLGLAEYINRTWQELSGGYKLRYALAKALVWQPRLLIIDEPLAHLDIRAQLIVLEDLRKIANSDTYPIAILLSSQHIHEIENIADQILFISNGELENCGNTNTYNTDREYNYFELNGNFSKHQLQTLMQELPCRKIQYTNISYILHIDKSITALALQQFFSTKDITLHFFRDISQSIKTKFYESKEE